MKSLTTRAPLISTLALSLALIGACERGPATDNPDPNAQPSTAAVDPLPSWPDEAFRAQRPTPKPIRDTSIPTIESFELSNGVQVHLVYQDRLPTIELMFTWELGSIADPKGKSGVGTLCASLMGEATANKDKAAFKAAQDDHALNVWVGSSAESSYLGMNALTSQLTPGLDLMAETLFEPGLRSADFERIRDQHKAWLEQRKGSASSIARRVFPALTWGSKHRYARQSSEASLDSIKLSDCKRWVRKLRPDGATLWVNGNITRAELEPQLEQRFAKWSGAAPKAPKIGVAKPAAGTLFFVHVPKAAQSQIMIGHPGPPRVAPDYEATDMVARILGGSFSSRINMNLREDKGWAYGARASFSYRRGGSLFIASSSVRSDATGGALREIAKEIQLMRESDPSPTELKREQEGALLALPSKFSTASRTLSSFRSLAFFGLPFDWHTGHQQRLRALDLAAVRAAAEAHLQASDPVVLVVGDAEVVLQELEQLAQEGLFGDGGIIYLDNEGERSSRPKVAAPVSAEPSETATL